MVMAPFALKGLIYNMAVAPFTLQAVMPNSEFLFNPIFLYIPAHLTKRCVTSHV